MGKKKTPPKMKSYHFDVGNSTAGAIGLCARVTATSKAAAVHILRDNLPEEIEAVSFCEEPGKIEYLNIYINPEMVTIKNIDIVDDPDDEENGT